MAKARTPDPTTLKRESAGTYRTPDGRFTVQEASGRWMLLDAEEQDDLGLPLTRGPFETLADARAAIADARSGPAPTSTLEARLKARPRDAGKASEASAARSSRQSRGRSERTERTERAERGTRTARSARAGSTPEPAAIEIRRYRHGDGEALRALWQSAGLRSVGDDDESLDRMADRNPGLLLVATEGERVIGSALGAWDGRRGWIYHVATAETHRRGGLGGRLVREVERKLRQLGCPRVNVVVRDENADGVAFWEALGYAAASSRQFGKEL